MHFSQSDLFWSDFNVEIFLEFITWIRSTIVIFDVYKLYALLFSLIMFDKCNFLNATWQAK